MADIGASAMITPRSKSELQPYQILAVVTGVSRRK
jgi:hypothetical protein